MVVMVLVWVILGALSCLVFATALVVRALWRRLQAFERRLAERPLSSPPAPLPTALDGLRVALDVRQDHPHAPFATLLRETLEAEGAQIVEDDPDLSVRARVVGNGYADVVFTADLAISDPRETVLAWTEKPPHGDRPENLAREIASRLKAERAKRERQRALDELRVS